MLNQTQEWSNLLSSYKHFVNEQRSYRVMNDTEKVRDFLLALNDPFQKVFALHLLKDQDANLKKACFCKLVEISVYGNAGYLGFARDIVLSLEKKWIELNIDHAILAALDRQKESELDYVYRNVAHLFKLLEMPDKLKSFIEKYCKDSDNDDVREVFEDYSLDPVMN